MLITAQALPNSFSSVLSSMTTKVKSGDLCIIGDGAVGLAAGCILADGLQKLTVVMPVEQLSRDKSRTVGQPTLKELAALPVRYEIRERGAASAASRESTNFSSNASAASAITGAAGIVIACPATEYGALVNQIASSFVNGQSVYLINAPLAGGIQFAYEVGRRNSELQLNIVEIGSLFDWARIEGETLVIGGLRERVVACGVTRNETWRGLKSASNLSKELVPASNVLERGLMDVEKLVRPAILMTALLGARGRELECVSNSVNPNLTALIVALEQEIRQIARAFRCVSHSFLETLTDFGGVCWDDADCLDQALISVAPALLGQVMDSSEQISVDAAIEVLKKDVIETLVLLSEFARVSRTPAPVLSSIIELSSVIARVDSQKQGRRLSDLGLIGFDAAEITEIINA